MRAARTYQDHPVDRRSYGAGSDTRTERRPATLRSRRRQRILLGSRNDVRPARTIHLFPVFELPMFADPRRPGRHVAVLPGPLLFDAEQAPRAAGPLAPSLARNRV